MDKKEYAEYLASLSEQHKKFVEKHITDYGEILPHVLADCLTLPLSDALRNGHIEMIQKYCAVLETLWKEGDSNILNVLEVTILEYLTDDPQCWQRFGKSISPEFRSWINREIVPYFKTYLTVEKL